MLKINSKNKNILVIVIFFVFIFLRLFSDSQYYFIQSSDAARYLTLANNFPKHTLDNNQLHLTHPPLYSYTIHFMNFLFEDHIAGILVSLISAIISFFLVYRLTILINNNPLILYVTLILFSLSQIYINISKHVLKESFAVMLTLASIYYYLKFFKEGKNKNIVYSTFFSFLTGLTTDHAILLIPSLIIIYFIFRNKTKIWKASIPLTALVLSYSFWIAIRLYTYVSYDYYPAALDGTIVNINKVGIKQLLSSQYFDEAEIFIPFGLSFDPLHYLYPLLYMLNLIILPWPSGLRFSTIATLLSTNYLVQLLIYSILSIGGIYSLYRIIGVITKKNIKRNGMLLCLILFFIFIFPLTQKFTSTRYTITAIIFLYILISFGLFELAKALKVLRLYKISIIGLILSLILYLPSYYSNNNHFILSQEKIVEAKNTAEFINQLPKDGVMAQIGYTQELNYLTNKRVMALPVNPNYMFLIDIYNISYVIYGEFYMKPISEANKKDVINYDTIKYIREHSNQFKLLKVIEETYPTTDRIDHIYVYEVIKK